MSSAAVAAAVAASFGPQALPRGYNQRSPGEFSLPSLLHDLLSDYSCTLTQQPPCCPPAAAGLDRAGPQDATDSRMRSLQHGGGSSSDGVWQGGQPLPQRRQGRKVAKAAEGRHGSGDGSKRRWQRVPSSYCKQSLSEWQR